jgi:hypothetical protein
VGGAVAVRRLGRVAHLALWRQRKAVRRHRRATHVDARAVSPFDRHSAILRARGPSLPGPSAATDSARCAACVDRTRGATELPGSGRAARAEPATGG